MKKRCPNAVAIGTAYINDYALAFRRTGKPCLTVDKKMGSKVPVAVWEITPSDEDELDYFEGYPDSYKKLRTNVKILETGKVVKGFMYVMKENQEYARPLQDYWIRCVTGYNDFGLNLKYLRDALNYSTKHLGEY